MKPAMTRKKPPPATCKTCRHWTSLGGDFVGSGSCGLECGLRAVVWNERTSRRDRCHSCFELRTPADFGCVHHQPAEERVRSPEQSLAQQPPIVTYEQSVRAAKAIAHDAALNET